MAKQNIFSISRKYKKVKEILANTENASGYICQAVLEKYERDNNINNEIDTKSESDFITRDELNKELEDILNKIAFLQTIS